MLMRPAVRKKSAVQKGTASVQRVDLSSRTIFSGFGAGQTRLSYIYFVVLTGAGAPVLQQLASSPRSSSIPSSSTTMRLFSSMRLPPLLKIGGPVGRREIVYLVYGQNPLILLR